MYLERKEDLSIFYWLKEEFQDTPFIKIVDGFPEELLALPTISVEWEQINGYPIELGNRQYIKERQWYLDVFAVNKSQRDEITYRLFNMLADGIPVNDYDEGFPENGVTPTKINTLLVTDRQIRNLHKYEEDIDTETEVVYYRAVVIFSATPSQI